MNEWTESNLKYHLFENENVQKTMEPRQENSVECPPKLLELSITGLAYTLLRMWCIKSNFINRVFTFLSMTDRQMNQWMNGKSLSCSYMSATKNTQKNKKTKKNSAQCHLDQFDEKKEKKISAQCRLDQFDEKKSWIKYHTTKKKRHFWIINSTNE